MKLNHLLAIEGMTKQEIETIIETSKPFKNLFTRSVKKVPVLRGQTVVNLFFEPSTRTRTSFELAAKRLEADVINFVAATSSLSKGETVVDTAQTIESMSSDIIVMRHSQPGAASLLSKNVKPKL